MSTDSTPRSPESAAARGRLSLWVFVAVTAVGVLLAPGYVDNVDARVCMRSAASLVDEGTFALLSPSSDELTFLWTARGVDGTVWSKFGDGAALVLLPFLLLGRLLSLVLPGDASQTQEFVVSLSSAVYLGLAAVVSVRLLRDLGLRARAATFGTAAFVFGTYQLVYSGSTYRETPMVLAVLLAVWCAVRAVRARTAGAELRWAVGSGAALAALFLVKSAAAVAIPALALTLLGGDVRGSLRRGVCASVPLVLAVGYVLLTNDQRFGGPFESGYVSEEDLFSTPLLDGVRAFAVDPDQSLPLFAPAWALALVGLGAAWRRARLVTASALLALLGLVLLHAKFFAYHGGTAYGPRYLLPGIALLTALPLAAWFDGASASARRVGLGVVLLLALWQLPQTLVAPSEYHTIRGHMRSVGVDRSLLGSHLPTHLRVAKADVAGEVESIPWSALGVPPDDRLGDAYAVPRIEQGPALWWWLAGRERGPAYFAIGGLLLVVVSVSVLRVVGELRRPDDDGSAPTAS